jgi:predicted permease
MRFLDTLLRDLRYGFRTLLRAPTFTAIAVISLGLGIGATTAIFSVTNAVLLRPLPVPAPEELRVMTAVGAGIGAAGGQTRYLFSYPSFEQYRDAVRGRATLLAQSTVLRANLSPPGVPATAVEPVSVLLVSGEYFNTLGVPAETGRTLTPQDNRHLGGHPVAVLSHRFWTRRFGGDARLVGNTVHLNGVPFTVVGVASPSFTGTTVGEAPDIWIPIMMQADVRYSQNAGIDDADGQRPWSTQAGIQWLHVMLRLVDDGDAGSVESTLDVTRRHLVSVERPNAPPEVRRRLEQSRTVLAPGVSGFPFVRDDLNTPLLVLMTMVLLLMLIACANVACLLLARGAARHREMAVRVSLGAGRLRVLRQLLTESLLLSLAGAAVGVPLAIRGGPALLNLLSGGGTVLPVSLQPDLRVLAFASTLAVVTGVLFGIAPALRLSRIDAGLALAGSLRGTASAVPVNTRGHFFTGKTLVVTQVTLALLLLVVAGLFARTLQRLASVDAGIDRENLLVVRYDLRAAGYTEDRLPLVYDTLLERIRALPGVRSAAIALTGVLTGGRRISDIRIAGQALPPGSEGIAVQEDIVDPAYFATMGMTFVRGRGFGAQDHARAPSVSVVNETMAKRYFRGVDPIGQRWSYGGDRQYEIVGIVRDARYNSLKGDTPAMCYRPVAQNVEHLRTLYVRTARPAAGLAADVRGAIAAMDPKIGILRVLTMREQIDRTLTQERLVAQLTSSFGISALLLAAVGLYGTMAYGVARRRPELGLRMALGATPAGLLRLVLRESMILVALGLGIGIPVTLVVTRLLREQLFGVAPGDPATLAFAAAVMTATALLAAYVPARRASRVHPAVALRAE